MTQRDRAASLVLGTAATVTVRLPRRWTANSTLFCLSVALIAGGGIVFDRYDHQYQTELPERRPRVTRFTVGIGHCADCARRVQGRHPEQTSDALGAAGSHLGPNARGFGHWLHYVLGLSFAKAASVLARLGVPVTAGALSSGAQSTARALVPTTAKIVAKVASSEVVVMDETGVRHEVARFEWLRKSEGQLLVT